MGWVRVVLVLRTPVRPVILAVNFIASNEIIAQVLRLTSPRHQSRYGYVVMPYFVWVYDRASLRADPCSSGIPAGICG